MAKWDNAANSGLNALKAATNASDADIVALKSAIENWLANNPGSHSHQFPFAALRHRNHSVTATFANGWITDITYGDR